MDVVFILSDLLVTIAESAFSSVTANYLTANSSLQPQCPLHHRDRIAPQLDPPILDIPFRLDLTLPRPSLLCSNPLQFDRVVVRKTGRAACEPVWSEHAVRGAGL